VAHNYIDPVAKLLTFGESPSEKWLDYLALGFTQDHVPELIRMATDLALHNDDDEEDYVWWAPIHAWRALAQLKAEGAAQPLVLLFDELWPSDWLAEEFPTVFSMIGCSTVPVLVEFLADNNVDPEHRASIPGCLQQIAEDHPTCRQTCIDALTRQLEKYATNADFLNGFLVAALGELKAVDAIALIREAHAKNCVDISIVGDLEEAEILIGVRESRSTPPPRYQHFPGLPQPEPDNFDRLLKKIAVPTIEQRRTKVSRNEPCPCGSGKKYKKCCLQ